MTGGEHYDATTGDQERPIAELVEQITRKLQANEPFEADEYLKQFPACSAPIHDLLPTLRDLSELGRSLARNPHRRGSRRAADEP